MNPNWRLSHARGYVALGLHDLAEEELAALGPERASDDEVLALRVEILQARQQWLMLQPLVAELVKRQPKEPGWWIVWAYATRRAESLFVAEAILREAELLHPDEATIQFNLGCYACQRGDLADARIRVERAQSLNPAFRDSILTDSDLAPLRATGYQPPAS
jgi:Flp pilus assembly protein TadD